MKRFLSLLAIVMMLSMGSRAQGDIQFGPDEVAAFSDIGRLINGLTWSSLVSESGDKVVVELSRDGEPVQTLRTRCHDWVGVVDHAGQPILADANFDCFPDILVSLGSYGTQGLLYYTCFLYDPASGLYVEDKSFDHIPNPVIDTVGKRICGEARANAREVELTEYRYDGKQFYRESSTTVVFE